MDFMIRGRQEGKTTEAIRRAAEDFAYIVCADRQRVRQVQRRAEELGLDIPFPLTFAEFTGHHFYGKGIGGFVIDDVQELIQYLAGEVPVRLVTGTGNAY